MRDLTTRSRNDMFKRSKIGANPLMEGGIRPRRIRVVLLVLAGFVSCATCGCSQSQYRLQADRDAYDVIAERNADPRWRAEAYDIDMEPRSRYFDPHDPDRSPMPLDDPTSQQYMREVNGMAGWEHWNDNGLRSDLENPTWKETLGEDAELTESGELILNVDSSVQLAYVHSPTHQEQLETLYLSALDVTAERFRLDTQYYGGFGTAFAHNGSLDPSGLSYDAASGKYVVSGPSRGIESNRLTVGSSSASPTLQVQRSLATAGQLLAGFANSFVFEFSGGDASLSSSLANFVFVQPLLRGAGRDIALEDLTRDERALLGNLRAYGQFRQGFYTQVAIGESGVSGPRRGGQSTSIQVASGDGGVGGYIGLLQDIQRIRNSQNNLDEQLGLLSQTIALEKSGLIDLVQVDLLRQRVQETRATLLDSRNALTFSIDRFKTGTLGLPPDLPVKMDDSLLRPFELISPESNTLRNDIRDNQGRVGSLPPDSSAEDVRKVLDELDGLARRVRQQLDTIKADLVRLAEAVPQRELSMSRDEKATLQQDRVQLANAVKNIEQEFTRAKTGISAIRAGLNDKTAKNTIRQMVVWTANLMRLVQRSMLVQARARLETVTIPKIELDSAELFDVALANRLDFMNGRASLVDSWRTVQVRADALQAVLNVTSSGDVRTAGNNPADFRAATSTLRLGLEVDAPLTRLLERNAYRESLVNFQRSRRGLIRSRDALNQGLRQLVRDIDRLQLLLEIQRQAVAIGIRQLDVNREQLNAPVRPGRPGEIPAGLSVNTTRNLMDGLKSLLESQNKFMNTWFRYYAARMRLARELGIMKLDQHGRWIEQPAGNNDDSDDSDDDAAAAFRNGWRPTASVTRRSTVTSKWRTAAAQQPIDSPPPERQNIDNSAAGDHFRGRK